MWACPDGGVHNGLRGWGVGEAVGVPPFRASFALEKGGSRELVPGPFSTAMTRALGVLCIEFGVMDTWEDFQG